MKIELPKSQFDSYGRAFPKILAILPALIPSSIILVVEPLFYLLNLRKIEFRVRLEDFYVRSSDLEWADLIVFCRNTEPVANEILEKILALKKPYIYELDDNFFELPLDSPDGKYHRAPERIAQLEKYIKNASLVRVYSNPLELRIKKYTTNTKFVKAPVNLFAIPVIPPNRISQKMKLVFSTSRIISDDLSQIFVKDIIRIINEFGNSIEVHFWGFIPEELRDLPSVKFYPFMPNYQNYMRKIYEQGYDIGLAPMKNDMFHNSKTNNKFREYGACWIAGVYSNTEVYAGSVVDGVTGVLVSNDEGEWYKAIVRMMTDVDRRETIQVQARATVEKEYSLPIFAEVLLKDINSILQEFIEKDIVRIANVQETKKMKLENKLDLKKIFLQFTDLIRFIFGKIYRLRNSYGLLLTYRLFLNAIGRYAQYFFLSFKIKQVTWYFRVARFFEQHSKTS